MTTGLEKTLKLLASTNNDAATTLLLGAIDSADREVQAGALRSLVKRRSPAGHAALLRRWDSLSERHKAAIAEQPHRMSGALRDAVLSGDEELSAKALDAVVRLREYDLVPTLITAAEDKANPRAADAARTVIALCELLYEEVAGPRDRRLRRDPRRMRKFVLSSLEVSVNRFDLHKRGEILEAFVLLAAHDNLLLRQLLQNVHGKPYLQITRILGQSTRPAIQELLLDFLEDPHPPSTIHTTLSRRRDMPFLRRFFSRFCDDPRKVYRINARRIESFSWGRDAAKILKAVSDDEQRGLVQLLKASGINRLEVFRVVQLAIAQGGTPAKQAASAMLAEFHGADANRLVLECLKDTDPVVRANVVGQLRERGIPGAMQKLIEAIDSPDDVVSEAARVSLSEFSFERLLSSFDLLSEDVARTTGWLVKRVDLSAIEKLTDEFDSPSRTRRLRALAVSVAMGAVQDVEQKVLEMLADSDHFIRAEAARAAAQCDSHATRVALRDLLLDRSPSVQEAAEQTLQSFAESTTPPPPVVRDPAGTTADLLEFSRGSLP